MKILRAVNFSYTLYEDDHGSLILDLLIPSTKGGWANYEKRVVIDGYKKFLIRAFPESTDHIASKLIAKEKRQQLEK